ncbi:Rhodanese/Cell cycle control phosphatase superfamily protein [Arabidopsis thaliana]|uniref:Rhodanese-like domain-containing protein 17 n=2 Tax=Arabidopsis thaliana TaxID=3702 RepID=STR17_ARATH|nr:Rhodanese/Cell cycle control phosphatase superfamily protein [Arabidopsis thaliana]F4IPI4.1 RecName: Full=Rhodanese-like domain-containing protein 17; AltName: Full=Sulfurtransferase 17; Short=AtStr17 [Arabidopsis thaliana]AEC06695.1 Rhodanese/Cell cycle control phosphatase superfamily protein [Arabidopsis thaliana]|eukprot:NP_565426.2 Rhodanese/Cell cycle control phosphatase superfamily protein [Arabidopsis thaliana]
MDSLHVLRSFLLLFIVFNHLPRTTTSMSEPKVITIDVNQAQKLLDSGYTFLDVRTVEEFKKGHVDSENVFNVPYWLYTPQGQEINPNFLKHVSSLCNQTDHLILGCKSGVRSLHATKFLVSSGFKTVRNMDGGYIAWVNKRFPVKVEHKELKYDEL